MDEAPVFVKIDKYKDITSILNKIQERLDSTNKMIDNLEALKNEEDERIKEWKESLELVQAKLGSVGGAFQ